MNLFNLNCIVIFAINIENPKNQKCYKYLNKYEKKTFEAEESTLKCSDEILKIDGLINNIKEYKKIHNNVWRKHKSIRLKNIDGTKSYWIEEIDQNELISKKYEKVYRLLSYIEHLLILISTLTTCASISVFVSLIGILVGITSSAIVLNICVKTSGMWKYKSIIKKKKKINKILLLAKSKLKSVEVLISKTFIDSNICHNECCRKKLMIRKYGRRWYQKL